MRSPQHHGREPTAKRAGSRTDPPRRVGGKRPPDSFDNEFAAKSLRADGVFGVQALPVAETVTWRKVRELTNLVRKMHRQLYPRHSFKREAIEQLIWEAFRSTDDEFGEEEALRWAEGYEFPADIADRDSEKLRAAGGNLAEMTSDRHAEMASAGRLSKERIEAMVPRDDEDYDRLIDLVDGIDIQVADDFVPNTAPSELRAKYVRVAPAVNRLMAELHSKGLIFILPTAEAMEIPGIHYSQTHWALKKGKEQGRPIGDVSAKDIGGYALNCDEVADICTERYGEIKHPTLTQLADMVKAEAATHGFDDLVLWKMDLKGAFTLLFVKPETCHRLAFALTGGLTMIYHVGMFGWTGMPAAFQVVTRVISRLVGRRLKGRALMYVDDLMGVCRQADLEHDLGVAREICNGLLGPGAVEEKKTQTGQCLDFIGWQFDLRNRTVSVARHNFLKTLYGMLQVDVRKKVPVRSVQRLASWASRYSAVCRQLKPFTQDLFNMIRGRHQHVSVDWSPEAIQAIDLWRATLVALHLDPDRFARPICSIGTRSPEYLLEYDASLTGIGFVLSSLTASGAKADTLCAAMIPLTSYLLDGASTYQNTCEFLAVVTGLAVLAERGVKHSAVHIIGDNMSSLAWADNQSFHSTLSKAASMAFMAITTVCDIQIAGATHIRGIRNIIPDTLSRAFEEGVDTAQIYAILGFHPDICLQYTAHPLLQTLISACNPRETTTSSSPRFLELWGTIADLADSLASDSPV